MSGTYLYEISEQILGAYSMFLLCFLLYKMFGSQLPKKRIYVLIAVFSVAEIIILDYLGNIIDFDESSLYGMDLPIASYYFSTYFLMGLLFSLFLKGSIIGKISICLFFIAIQLTVNPISGSLVRIYYEDYANIPFTVINHALLTLLILFVYRHAKVIRAGAPIKYVVGIIIVALTTVFILIYLSYEFATSTYSSLTGALFSIAFATTNLSVFFISDMLFLSNQKNEKLAKYFHRTKLNHMQMKETQNMIEILNTASHEMKNMIFVMKSLLEKDEYDELQAYFNRFSEELQLVKIETYCGNSILDAILNRKSMDARVKNIPITIKAAAPENLPIDSVCLSTVLFNSINNAIEASIGMDHPEIYINIRVVKSYLSITVRNRVESNILEKNPHLLTTKKNKEHHGIGINVIQKMVRQNNGMLRFFMEKDFFCVSMMLLLSEPCVLSDKNELPMKFEAVASNCHKS